MIAHFKRDSLTVWTLFVLLSGITPHLLSSIVPLQFARYEDNFVREDLELNFERAMNKTDNIKKGVRRINRRDAARAVAETLTSPHLQGTTVQIWTDELN